MLERPSSSAMRSLQQVCGRVSRPAARHFSTTPACAVRAVFAETGNEDLNTTLATIQEKIILPAYLPPKQRDRVFNPKMKTHLEQNPIVIEIEGLEHKFSTIDRFSKHVPNSKTILNTALRQMRDPGDWANLGTLLAGYKKAGIRLQPDSWAKIVRTAGNTGNIFAVIECAKQADSTGLKLADAELVALVFSHINDKIVAGDGAVEHAGQALRWAEIVLDLMQRPPHEAGSMPSRYRLHFSRVVRGLTLFTRASAVKAKQQAGEPVEKDLVLLKDEVDLILSLWKGRESWDLAKAPDFSRLNPATERASSPNGKGVKTPRALNGTAYMQVLSQSIKGMSLARELLGEAAQALAPIEVNLANHLKEHAKTRKETSNWTQQYEKIVGFAPQW